MFAHETARHATASSHNNGGDPDEVGDICACDVVSSDPGSIDGRQRLAWKFLTKGKLSSQDPAEECDSLPR